MNDSGIRTVQKPWFSTALELPAGQLSPETARQEKVEKEDQT